VQRGEPRPEPGDTPRDDADQGDVSEEEREGRRRRRGRRGGRGRGGRANASDANGANGEVAAARGGDRREAGRDAGRDASDDGSEGGRAERAPAPERDDRDDRDERGERPERGERGGRGGRGGRGRGRDGGGRNGGGRNGGRARRDDDREPRGPIREVDEEDEVIIPGTPDELPAFPNPDAADDLDLAGSSLRDILTLLGYTATEITARDPETPGDGEGLIEQIFDIYGEDDDTSDELGVLIGRRGETLASLQYLVNTIVSKGGNKPPVFGLDIEGYRRRREQMLVDLAREIAQEVRETGDVITLEPMPAYERRIVHIALREEPGVKTESVGSGDDRQVEVMPD